MKVAPVLAALESVWERIQEEHPQLPDQFITLTRTHEQHAGWVDEHGITITTHTLDRDAEDVLGALLHEAAHVLAGVRGIKDIRDKSQGEASYHNKHFKLLAEEVGLKPFSMKDDTNGWHTSMLTKDTKVRYARELELIDRALNKIQPDRQ